MGMAISKKLLREDFTGSSYFESYITHFEIQLGGERWKRVKAREKKSKQMNGGPTFPFHSRKQQLTSNAL